MPVIFKENMIIIIIYLNYFVLDFLKVDITFLFHVNLKLINYLVKFICPLPIRHYTIIIL